MSEEKLSNFEITQALPVVAVLGNDKNRSRNAVISIAHKYNIDRWAAFCSDEADEKFWAEHARVHLLDSRGKKYLEKIQNYQQRKSKYFQRELKQTMPKKYDLGIILDNIHRLGSPAIHGLFQHPRGQHIFIIVMADEWNILPPLVCVNIDYLFFTVKSVHKNIRDWIKNTPTFEELEDALKTITPLDFLVCSQEQEPFFVYTPEPPEIIAQMKLGSIEWREYQQKHEPKTKLTSISESSAVSHDSGEYKLSVVQLPSTTPESDEYKVTVTRIGDQFIFDGKREPGKTTAFAEYLASMHPALLPPWVVHNRK